MLSTGKPNILMDLINTKQLSFTENAMKQIVCYHLHDSIVLEQSTWTLVFQFVFVTNEYVESSSTR